MVPGGRVELPTPAFSGPRSTGELPRRFGRQKIVRVREARRKGLDFCAAIQFEHESARPVPKSMGRVGRYKTALHCWRLVL
jgi:hypothetical protein